MSHRKTLIAALGVVLLTVLGSVSVAEAQGYPPPYYPPPPPPPRGVYRSGIIYGFSLGLGAIHINDCLTDVCGASFAGEVHLGGMISPRAAVMFEAWGADHPWSSGGSSFETINSFFTGAAQYWLNDILWVKGGLGLGVLRQNYNSVDYYGNVYVASDATTGFALFGAAGVEVLQSYNFALDIQARIGNGFYSDKAGSFSAQNFALLVGFNWY